MEKCTYNWGQRNAYQCLLDVVWRLRAWPAAKRPLCSGLPIGWHCPCCLFVSYNRYAIKSPDPSGGQTPIPILGPQVIFPKSWLTSFNFTLLKWTWGQLATSWKTGPVQKNKEVCHWEEHPEKELSDFIPSPQCSQDCGQDFSLH